MLGLRPEAIGTRAEAVADALRSHAPDVTIRIEDGQSEVGGGALPLQALPTRILTLRPARGSATDLEARLRGGAPPVLVRIQEDRILLDLRTIADSEEPVLLQALRSALTQRSGGSP
jgi:L-seryl-tRNA(Ser) seleniumtransferase